MILVNKNLTEFLIKARIISDKFKLRFFHMENGGDLNIRSDQRPLALLQFSVFLLAELVTQLLRSKYMKVLPQLLYSN